MSIEPINVGPREEALHIEEVPREESDTIGLRLTGELDADGTPILRRRLQDLPGTGKRIHIDMENVSFVSSSGMGLLIHTARELREQDGDLFLHNVPEDILEVFRMLDVIDFLNIR